MMRAAALPHPPPPPCAHGSKPPTPRTRFPTPTSPHPLWAVAASLTLGALAAGAPRAVLAALVAVALVAALTRATGLAVWQMLALLALGGYIVLNYGFANLTVAGLPVGHLMMFAAFGAALLTAGPRLVPALRDSAFILILILAVLTVLRLTTDIPRHGVYAARDASFLLEGVFLLLGLLWGAAETRLRPLLRWLLAIFLLNLAYSFTIPWGLAIKEHSPSFGLFQQVPLLGSYTHSYLYLLLGALFCLGPARHVVRWPRWVLFLLAALQLFGLALHQARTAYLGIVVAVVVLAAFGQARQSVALGALILTAVLLLLSLTALGVVLEGRVGPVNAEFLREHVQSLLLKPGTPQVGSLQDRADWYAVVWSEIRSTTRTLLFGVGFGQPLITFQNFQRVAVRQPHNTHLSVWARLGIVGLVFWLALHGAILWRLLTGLSRPHRVAQPYLFQVLLWCFLYFLFSIADTTVQPHLEFSQGAIPFYFLVGVALALRRRFEERPGSAPRAPAPAY